jgi:glutamate formiminotransferase/glutamate formiminotransferase/formiminotetrahydrofolate cyclodeaminase
MNLTDLDRTSLAEAYRAVEREAARLGVVIHSSEIVGLVPQSALEGARLEEMKLADFSSGEILENRLAAVFMDRASG